LIFTNLVSTPCQSGIGTSLRFQSYQTAVEAISEVTLYSVQVAYSTHNINMATPKISERGIRIAIDV
jgi:hypothetical protein